MIALISLFFGITCMFMFIINYMDGKAPNLILPFIGSLLILFYVVQVFTLASGR